MEVEIKTCDTILDRGVRVPVPAPLLFRWIGIKTIAMIVRRPTLGNMLRISRMYLAMGVDIDAVGEDWREWIAIMTRTAVPVSRIVAMGMLRGRISGYLLHRPLGWWLRHHCTSDDLANIAALLVSLSGVQDFMNTIRFLKAMKMTEPRNVSP